MNILFEGILLGISITAPVGPTNVEIIRRGIQAGWRAAAAFSFGSIVALILYLSFVTVGFAKVADVAWFNTTLAVFGVIVLAYLAYNSLRDFFAAVEIEIVDSEQDQQRHFLPGIILTIANPAVLLFWTGIMGASFASAADSASSGSVSSFLHGLLTGAVLTYVALIALIYYARQLLQDKLFKYVSLAAGLLLAYFCLKFGYALLATWVL